MENTEKKTVTRYDRKMNERREKEAAKKRRKRMAIAGCVAVIAVVALIVGITEYQKNNAATKTYITIGTHDFTQVEYDYYYSTLVNSYLNSYGYYLVLMGLDTSKAYDKQMYTETLTWKDYFDQMTVVMLTEVVACLDDAAANGFEYDVTTDYDTYVTQISASATEQGVNESYFYKNTYGKYATKSSIETYVKEYLTYQAYYNKLLEDNEPTDEDVAAYYEEYKMNYDNVDYHIFTFTADIAEEATDEEITQAMADIKEKADEMLTKALAGDDFKALCEEYADEDSKATYQDTESDASLTESATYGYTSTLYSTWLYDESRQAGDATVIEDTTSHKYYVLSFVDRYYDETNNDTISSTIASNAVSDYINVLIQGYEVSDPNKHLNYLYVEETTADTTADSNAETQSVDQSDDETQETDSETESSESQ